VGLEHRVSVKGLPRQLIDPLHRDGVADWEDDVGRQLNANSRRLHLAAGKRSDELRDLAIGKAEADPAQRLTLAIWPECPHPSCHALADRFVLVRV